MGEELLREFEAAHLPERGWQRRPGEHRRGRAGDLPTGAAEAFDHHVAALLIQLAVPRDDILRAVERGAGRGLDGREGAVVEVGFDPRHRRDQALVADRERSEEHTTELQSLMRSTSAVYCLKQNKQNHSPKN